ncbi:hypothetical protein [Aureimonas sp. Leaf324]|nr:hypothetical protein [Aureimonas sp. Leaf324]
MLSRLWADAKLESDLFVYTVRETIEIAKLHDEVRSFEKQLLILEM